MRTSLVVAAIGAASLSMLSADAWAGSKIFSSGSSTLTVNGSVESNANGNRDPWVAQVFSLGGSACLRVVVTSQGADLEATLISPSGRVWQDDDSNGSLRPRILAVTDTRGWYTLALSHFAGNAVNADFTMQISRGGVCSPATPPSVLAAQARKAAGGELGGPRGGAN
jgi:hypothetical protein